MGGADTPLDADATVKRTPLWVGAFVHDFKAVFVTQWSPYTGAMALVLVNLFLIAGGDFWGVFGGIRLWGDHFNNLIGLGPLIGVPQSLDDPFMHRISLMNMALLLGAFAAALLSSQFRINRAPAQEYAFAALGGTLMGGGALLAGGCTTGGFFTPLLFSSPAGWVMLAGLFGGAAVGLKLLLWAMENLTWGTRAPKTAGFAPGRAHYPLFGAAVAVAVVALAASWLLGDDARLLARAPLILGGFAIGFILVRSRFCISRVVREPLMTGEGEMTKAFILAVALGAPLTAPLLAGGLDPYVAIPPRFWIGSLAGGFVFGIGMILAGGCASGSLWRMGEGHLKLWVALFFFAWSGSTLGALMNNAGLLEAEMNLDLVEETALGVEAFWPALLGGWGPTLAVTFALLGLWYALVNYNETTNRFTIT